MLPNTWRGSELNRLTTAGGAHFGGPRLSDIAAPRESTLETTGKPGGAPRLVGWPAYPCGFGYLGKANTLPFVARACLVSR